MFSFSVYNSACVLRTPVQPRRSRAKFVQSNSISSRGGSCSKSSKQQKYSNVASKALKNDGVAEKTPNTSEIQPSATQLQPAVSSGQDDNSNKFFLPAGMLAAAVLYQAAPALAETLAILPAVPEELSLTAIVASLEQLGDAGAVLLLFVVTLAEMVPLVPTQPLAIASGILFWKTFSVRSTYGMIFS
ncbi:hypothetical protein CYMTET_28151 [Cymbomonas tetramitiformis]|uniref:Uncharacterized protein n=1 Tax=Cymbomonas tetramitiformis TaxID=36881 RepID=A0AAE0FNE0_9CHLO|nr:hypothetical protein CYMTET_28151 [Cymbomonas tetramitiformis]